MLRGNKLQKLWSIQELVQIIDRQSGTNCNPLENYSFTLLRKIKSENNLIKFIELNSKTNVKTKDNDNENDEKDSEQLPFTTKFKQEQTGKSLMKLFESIKKKVKIFTYNLDAAETKNRYGWENGRSLDWMLKHRSDKIINRLKKQFH